MEDDKAERRKEQKRASYRRWAAKNPGARTASSRKWREENPGYKWPAKEALVAEVNALKSAPCLDCGSAFPPECMDFDHVRGVKVGNVATLIHRAGREKVMEEIAKCELICANCHRIRTASRRSQT